MRYSLKEDLEFRPVDQRAEILAISGPTAPLVMAALLPPIDRDTLAKFGVQDVSEEAAASIVSRYRDTIFR